MLTEGASVAKNLGAKLPKYFDDASRAGGLPSSAEKKEKEEEEDAIRTFDSVIHMPFPVIFTHISQSSTYATEHPIIRASKRGIEGPAEEA